MKILLEEGTYLLQIPYKEASPTENEEAIKLIDDLDNYPHAFVLGCLMDIQIKAEKAWAIPYEISKEINGFKFKDLMALTQEDIENIFQRKKLHRFNNKMPKRFYRAIQKIHYDYDGVASKIWAGNKPRSVSIVKKLLEFYGAGERTANMAANILARDFKVPMADHSGIDIAPDVHVRRVFKRLGFMPIDAGSDALIHFARELNPEYPGVFDLPCWKIGQNCCIDTKPLCNGCSLNTYCPKLM